MCQHRTKSLLKPASPGTDTPSVEAAHTTIRRQLGRIMVEEGFVTPEQLAAALAEQHRTSKPLGQVLVDLGFVSAGAVANALAEQHGGLLKTEYGVSAGLAKPAPVPPEPELHVVETAEDTRRRWLVAELDVLREHCESLRRGLAMLESELERVRAGV
jgi:hypothetical protein